MVKCLAIPFVGKISLPMPTNNKFSLQEQEKDQTLTTYIPNNNVSVSLRAKVLSKINTVTFTGNDVKIRVDNPITPCLFHPKGVAVVGASSKNPESVGSLVLKNIVGSGYKDNLVVINPSGKAVYYNDKDQLITIDKQNNPDINDPKKTFAYTNIKDIPVEVETAIVVVSASEVLKVVQDCAKKGIKNLVVISNSFAETGNVQLQNDLVKICKDNGLTLIGPNCLGVASKTMDATFSPSRFKKGDIGFFTQSGAVGIATANMFENQNLGISAFASLGNKAGADEVTCLEYFKNDPETRLILGYLESVDDPLKLLEKAINISQKKPIIMVKSGRSEAGAKAAAAHTGSLAGGDGVYDALFKRAGIIRAVHNDDMFLYVKAFSRCPLPKGNKVLVITNGGGAGTLTADAVEKDYGLSLSAFSKELQDEIKQMLPVGASTRNPVDTVGSVSHEAYLKSLDKLMANDQVDAVVAYLLPIGHTIEHFKDFAFDLMKLQKKYNKPILGVFQLEDKYIKELENFFDTVKSEISPIPIYDTPEKAVKSLSKLVEYSQWKKNTLNNPDLLNPSLIEKIEIPPEKMKQIQSIVSKAVTKQDPVLSTIDASKIIDFYGINISKNCEITKDQVNEVIKQSLLLTNSNPEKNEILKLFDNYMKNLGIIFPVVMKISATGEVASHKSDVGGVILNINTLEDMLKAYNKIMDNVRSAEINGKKVKEEDIIGVQIQEMVQGEYELFAGVNVEGQAKMLEFGMGGKLIDILNKQGCTKATVSTVNNPLTKLEISDLIESTPSNAYFDTHINEKNKAYRGITPVNSEYMVTQLMHLDQLTRELPIKNININPFMISELNPAFPKAVDGRIILDLEEAKKWLK